LGLEVLVNEKIVFIIIGIEDKSSKENLKMV
jgi:hypothetical protein